MLQLRAHNYVLETVPFWRALVGTRRLSDSTAVYMRWIGGAWGTAITALFIGMALRGGIPRSPTPSDWQIYAQITLLIIVAVGGTLVWRFEALGASMITAGAIGLGVLAAVEHHPWRAFGVALAFYLPGLLFWLDWQRTRSARAVVMLAAVMVLLLTAGGVAAGRVYDLYFGPVQPESVVAARPVDKVEWIWAGAVTSDSATIKARLVPQAGAIRLALSTRSDLSEAGFIPPTDESEVASTGVATFQVLDLHPESQYWYAVEVDGVLDRSRTGRLSTFADGAFSFTVAFGSCAKEGSNGRVFDTIRQSDPDLFISTGDFFYSDIDVNDPARYWTAYGRTLSAPAQAELYRNVPVAYIWNDHDFGPNNSDSTSPGRESAQLVYRAAVPHYPLAAGDGAQPIYQAFTVGRVRFILTDLQSYRTPSDQPDDVTKTMLGAEQKAWLKQELLVANGRFAAIVWVSTDPWIVKAGSGAKGWGSYATERREIADFIAENQISGMMMLGGDAHMLAIDDGTNSDFSITGGASFPVFHAGALDRRGSLKGGPYSEGAYPGGGQFGLMTITDNGGTTIEIVWSGRDWRNDEIVAYRFTIAT